MKTTVAKRLDSYALTRIEVLVIVAVLTVMAVVVLIGIPQAKRKSQRIDCAENLKRIGLNFRLWSTTQSDYYPMAVSTNKSGTLEVSGDVWRNFLALSNEIGTTKHLVCPADKERVAATSWSTLRNANISYFIGLEALEMEPQSLLSGDSNLEVDGKPAGSGILNLRTNSVVGWTEARHNRNGNVVLGDGSVQQLTSKRLRGLLDTTGAATNRLAIP